MERPAGTRRRTFVGASGAAAAVPLVAACGGDRATDPSAAEPTSARPSEAGSTPAAPEPDESASARPGRPLVATDEVPVGGGKVLADEKVVVTQPTRGDFRAFTAVCTHQGCVVASVNDRQIVCYCHGSRFAIADGAVEQGPAQSPLAPVEVEVDGGEVRRA